MFSVRITFKNGSVFERAFKVFSDAESYCRNNISYSGGMIKRVEIDGTRAGNGVRAIWDSAWN